MPASTLTLVLKNEIAELSRLAEAIESHGASRGWSMKWITNATLSLDELVTNTISYGYVDTDEHEIRITFTEQDGALTVVLEDDGIAFNPFLEAAVPDLDASVEERRIGGLGVYFVKSLMDGASYERRGEWNRIALIQHARE